MVEACGVARVLGTLFFRGKAWCWVGVVCFVVVNFDITFACTQCATRSAWERGRDRE